MMFVVGEDKCIFQMHFLKLNGIQVTHSLEFS